MSPFQRLQQRYLQSIPEKIDQLNSAFEQAANDEWQGPILTELKTLAHRLAGSGGGYGFTALTDCARALEQTIEDYIEKRHATADAIIPAFSQLIILLNCLYNESNT